MIKIPADLSSRLLLRICFGISFQAFTDPLPVSQSNFADKSKKMTNNQQYIYDYFTPTFVGSGPFASVSLLHFSHTLIFSLLFIISSFGHHILVTYHLYTFVRYNSRRVDTNFSASVFVSVLSSFVLLI